MHTRWTAPFWFAVLVSITLAGCSSGMRSGSADYPSTSGTAGTSGSGSFPGGWGGATGSGAPAPVAERPPSRDSLPPDTPATTPGVQAISYNATLAPQLPRDPAEPTRPVLQVGVKATLGFDIGPKREDADASGEVSAEIARSTEDLPLTIIFGCDFCPPDAQFKHDITYRPRQRRSEWISFEFTPQMSKARDTYQEELHLLIVNRNTGRPIDRFNIPVTVKADALAAAPVRSVDALARARASLSPEAPLDIDVTIYAIAGSGPSVTFSFEPQSAAMKTLIGPLALDNQGNRKNFRSGVVDTDLVDQASQWAFDAMSAVSVQNRELAKLRATGVDAVIPEERRDDLAFSAEEARNVADLMAATGQTLYRNFFYRGADKTLASIVALLEQAGGGTTPLRMQIITDRLSMPWQYLHPVGPVVDPNKFWGMRFSLSVLRLNDGGENWQESDRPGVPRKILFAHYGTSSDFSVPLARGQISTLKAALPSMEVLPVYAGPDLIRQLKTEKDAIAGFITFMHASSGGRGGAPVLEFGARDKVEGADFLTLKDRVDAAEQDQRYLSLGPLTVLNACETGPALRLTQVKLASSLFQLGVKGAIVTEVSVWPALGDAMAKRLIPHLVRGETAADALTAARRELLADKNNPLGLLYAYYGDPAAKLVTSSGGTP